MVSELSVLIPIYNQNVLSLVNALLTQGRQLSTRFEILLYDDGSKEKFRRLHRPLNQEPDIRYLELRENIGRAAIRNRLAQDANYEYLLFLDNDSALPDDKFVQRYWESNQSGAAEVVIGGTIYEPNLPSEAYMLRWTYGKAREERTAAERSKTPYQSLTLNNMLIKKSTYLQHVLCTELTGYGHEDTKFGWELQASNVPVLHIDNPVIHLGLEIAADFLKKTRQAVKNLYQLYAADPQIPKSKLISSYEWLRKMKMRRAFVFCFQAMKGMVLDNLRSSEPSLKYFDLYKLYLFTRQALHQEPEA